MTTSDTEPLLDERDDHQPAAEREPSGAAVDTRSRGQTSIAAGVVEKLAASAAREVPEVVRLGGGASAALGGVVDRIRGSEEPTTGVSAEVGLREAAIDLGVVLRWPVVTADVGREVRRRVIERVERITGLDVVEVNVDVVDFAGEEDEGGGRRVQ